MLALCWHNTPTHYAYAYLTQALGGVWAMDMGTHQTPNMDMRTHIKGHQTPNTDMRIHIKGCQEKKNPIP